MDSNRGILIRDFDPVADLDGACRAFVSGFYRQFWPLVEEADPKVIRDIVLSFNAFGNQNLVADVDGDVVGILFGCVGMGPRLFASGLRKTALDLLPKLLSNYYNASRKARKHLQLIVKNYGPFVIFQPPLFLPFCEVLLFALLEEHRGKGIGRMMMDEFVRRARAGGCKRVVVCTDTTASWWFYPAYGFTRIKSAPLRDCYVISLPGEEVTGYVYSLRQG